MEGGIEMTNLAKTGNMVEESNALLRDVDVKTYGTMVNANVASMQ